MAAIVLVCTGNVCRSPMAEGFLRAELERRFGPDAPTVASCGTAGWEGSGATPEAVTAARERDVDIGSHVARRLAEPHVSDAQLVVGMAGEHRDAVVRRARHAAAKTFSLKEVIRLLEALPLASADPSSLAGRVSQADDLRRSGFQGNPFDEDVVDPLGFPLDTYRAVAWELDDLCGRLATGLFGRAPLRATLFEEPA
jgi:protein-tyrosine phosphatase